MASNWGGFLLLTVVLLHLGCDAFAQQRLVGGSLALGPIPYQVSLQARVNSGIIDRIIQMILLQSRSEWSHFCGGAIITNAHVVTAAHCMDGADQTKITIVAGTNSRVRGGTRYTIESYINHPEYAQLKTNDISIIKVAEPFVFSNTLSPIDFRSETMIGGGVSVKLSGWGYTTPLATFSLPTGLRTINLRTISNEQCAQQGYNITDSEICTSTGVLRGACMGDSGGPLTTSDRKVLIGIVSYGARICGAGRPEVYTRISKFVNWIEGQILPPFTPVSASVPDDAVKPSTSTVTTGTLTKPVTAVQVQPTSQATPVTITVSIDVSGSSVTVSEPPKPSKPPQSTTSAAQSRPSTATVAHSPQPTSTDDLNSQKITSSTSTIGESGSMPTTSQKGPWSENDGGSKPSKPPKPTTSASQPISSTATGPHNPQPTSINDPNSQKSPSSTSTTGESGSTSTTSQKGPSPEKDVEKPIQPPTITSSQTEKETASSGAFIPISTIKPKPTSPITNPTDQKGPATTISSKPSTTGKPIQSSTTISPQPGKETTSSSSSGSVSITKPKPSQPITIPTYQGEATTTITSKPSTGDLTMPIPQFGLPESIRNSTKPIGGDFSITMQYAS